MPTLAKHFRAHRPAQPDLRRPRRAALLSVALLCWSLLCMPLHAEPTSTAREYPGDGLVFLSAAVLDRLLSAANGSEYYLVEGDGPRLRVLDLRTAFDARPGGLHADLEAIIPGRAEPIPLTATGVLQAVVDTDADAATPQRLRLRPHLTELSPQLSGSAFDDMLRLLAAATVKTALNTLAGTLPAFDLPLARDFTLRRPASLHPVNFRLGNASIEGELQVPALRLTLSLAVRDLVFSRRGLFAVLSVGDAGDVAPAAAADELDALIPVGEDLVLLLKGGALVRLVETLNTLPPAARALGFRSNAARGRLASRKRLGLGCGSDARLNHPRALRGVFHLGPTRARWRDARLGLASTLGVDLRAGVEVRVKGFPAPCGLTSPRPRCRCAKGKTRFTLPVSINQGLGLAAELGFERRGDGGVDYHIDLVAPRELRLKPRIHLGRLGSFGIPMTIATPLGTINRGALPTVMEHAGSVEVGYPPGLPRHWRLRLTNTRVETDATGVAAGFAVELEFLEPDTESR